MYLTQEEEKILNGEEGEVLERMFRLLVRLGEIYGADKMIPIGWIIKKHSTRSASFFEFNIGNRIPYPPCSGYGILRKIPFHPISNTSTSQNHNGCSHRLFFGF